MQSLCLALLLACSIALGGAKTPLKRVTFKGSHLEITEVFKKLAEVSELNIVVSSDISGPIAISIDNLPWDEALDAVLAAKHLKAERRGNVLLVTPKAPAKN